MKSCKWSWKNLNNMDNKMNILITGGAGYIGSHAAKQILEGTEHNVTILDNLSTGSEKTLDTIRHIRDFKFIKMDLKEFDKVFEVLKENRIDTIIHFAASIVVPESVEEPLKYYMNNTVNSTNLIKCALEKGVSRFVFSSTAAVYGEPDKMPVNGISEMYQTNPINPYGMSKLMSERVLQDAAKANNSFKYIIFRYFNVAGADIHYSSQSSNHQELSPRIGQSFPNATHLIKIASECATGKREKMAIFGDDFDTQDGTGVRDYIHVDDLASAHIKAIEYLRNNGSDIFNLGYGRGYSVKEVISAMKKVTNANFKVETAPRRVGDPAILIADNSKYYSKFETTDSKLFKYNNLDLICQSAYEWEKRK